MAKRKKSNVGMILSGLSVLLGLAAIVMLFLPAVAIKDTDTTYTGLQVTFGYSVDIPIWGEAVVFKFSFMNLLAYILAAAGVVFAILSAMGKSGKFASFIAAAAFIAAGVLFVIQPSFIIRDDLTSTITDAINNFLGVDLTEGFTLAVGGIIAVVCEFLAGLLSLFKSFAK